MLPGWEVAILDEDEQWVEVGFDGKLDPDVIAERVERVSALADELVNQRAEARVGTRIDVLVEEWDEDVPVGRAAHQGPDVDGAVRLLDAAGVDLVAKPSGEPW